MSDDQSRGQSGWPAQPPADGGYGQADNGYGPESYDQPAYGDRLRLVRAGGAGARYHGGHRPVGREPDDLGVVAEPVRGVVHLGQVGVHQLASGRPDSFLFPLAAPRYARRELVTPKNELATVPQLMSKTPDAMRY